MQTALPDLHRAYRSIEAAARRHARGLPANRQFCLASIGWALLQSRAALTTTIDDDVVAQGCVNPTACAIWINRDGFVQSILEIGEDDADSASNSLK